MDAMPELKSALLDILYETRSNDLKLILGGGYGIYLKREYVAQTQVSTLLSELPETRSTNDLDLFLRPELLITSLRVKPLADALRKLGYMVIQGAEKYQFAKAGPTGGREGAMKIDLLTGPRSRFADSTAKVDSRRVQPRPSVDLHAHPVDEAILLENELLAIVVDGRMSNGVGYSASVHLPHPLTFAMMKLFAFRDRVEDSDKGFGIYHALDLYTILALMSEAEWNRAEALRAEHATNPMMEEAGAIVEKYFASPTALGMIRIQESPYYRKELELAGFMSALHDLFRPLAG